MVSIVTWNMNGIRSSNQSMKDVLDSLAADVICLQETKITRDMLSQDVAIVDGYTSYFSFSRKRPGYSGVATYCKKSFTPIKAEEGLTGTFDSGPDGLSHHENIRSRFSDRELKDLDWEGRCIITLHNTQEEPVGKSLAIINVYCPRADPDNKERLEYKLTFYEALQLRCETLTSLGWYVVIVGDLNTSHKQIDHCEPELHGQEFEQNPGRIWMDQFLSSTGSGFVDAFRKLHPLREGAFTCWNTMLGARKSNYGTRIDYIFVSSSLAPFLEHCDVMQDFEGSDHCPVRSQLQVKVKPSLRTPFICTCNYKEFAGKQQTITKFVTVRQTSVHREPAPALSRKTKQSSLLRFFKDVPLDIPENRYHQSVEEVRGVAMKASESRMSERAAVVDAWKSVMKGPSVAPLCKGHSEPCVLRTAKKKGPNMNRQFWACPRPVGRSTDAQSQCTFFQWLVPSRNRGPT